GELCEPRLLERHVIVVVDVVEADDALAARKQGLGHVKANKPGGAGDEDSHVQEGSVATMIRLGFYREAIEKSRLKMELDEPVPICYGWRHSTGTRQPRGSSRASLVDRSPLVVTPVTYLSVS